MCSVAGCEKPVRARGWCVAHWARWRRYGDPLTTLRRPPGSPRLICSMQDCESVVIQHGLCEKHFGRLRRNGGPGLLVRLSLEMSPREIWQHLSLASDDLDSCWGWMGHRNNHGYGKIGAKYAHRMAWETEHGPIPVGMEVCHSCDNPPCSNPRHLFLGPHTANMRDAKAKGRLGGGANFHKAGCQCNTHRHHAWVENNRTAARSLGLLR